jgi:hypothetical protein
MEYLSGGQLKRVFEKRLRTACSLMEGETDIKNVKLTKPLFSEHEVASIIKALL